MLPRAEPPEASRPPPDRLGRHAGRLPPRRLRPAAVGVGEHVEIRERQGLGERLGRLEVGVGLAGEPRDHVGPEPEVRDGLRQPLDERPVHRRRVGPAHRPERPVRAGLERHVEVAADPALADDQLDQLLREVGRQDRRQAQARQPGDVEEPPRQGGQRRSRVEVPAVVAEVHAGEDDLRVAGGDQRPRPARPRPGPAGSGSRRGRTARCRSCSGAGSRPGPSRRPACSPGANRRSGMAGSGPRLRTRRPPGRAAGRASAPRSGAPGARTCPGSRGRCRRRGSRRPRPDSSARSTR